MPQPSYGRTSRSRAAPELERRSERRIATLQRELDRDRRRHERLLDQYDDLRLEIEELKEAIQHRQRFLEALREAAPGTRRESRSGPPPKSKPEIAKRILWASVEPLYPRQVRDAAVQRGWLADTAPARNQLGVAMSKLARKGRLVRGPDGRYDLPKA